MDELSEGKKVGPFLGVVGAKDSEISLDLLIGSLCLSICLGVICGGEVNIILEDASVTAHYA